jgi:putative tryptophan/tyrosine transport system substrate-binding protein
MRRREFITLLSTSAAAWPLAARAQRSPMPLVGYLQTGPRGGFSQNSEEAFRQGLGELGFIEGRNVAIDYRYDEGQTSRLAEFATDLVKRRAAVIYGSNNGPALAAKAATTTIPIVFRIGADPVELGLAASLNRPGGNATGVSFLATATVALRIQMLHEAAPAAVNMGMLVNPSNPTTDTASKAV